MELDPTAQSITLEKDRDSSWAKINMSREPVNSMNYAFWQRLTDILQACEQSSEIRGVIFYRYVLKKHNATEYNRNTASISRYSWHIGVMQRSYSIIYASQPSQGALAAKQPVHM
jgi:hypothetical protein